MNNIYFKSNKQIKIEKKIVYIIVRILYNTNQTPHTMDFFDTVHSRKGKYIKGKKSLSLEKLKRRSKQGLRGLVAHTPSVAVAVPAASKKKCVEASLKQIKAMRRQDALYLKVAIGETDPVADDDTWKLNQALESMPTWMLCAFRISELVTTGNYSADFCRARIANIDMEPPDDDDYSYDSYESYLS